MQSLTPEDLVQVHDNAIRTTSIQVAEAFGKQHHNVLRSIQDLSCSDEFSSTHFSVYEETIQAGPVQRRSKVYEMTKDGFMFLVMGFTGKKAARIKEAYINAFNAMEQELLRQQQAKPKVPERLRLELTQKVQMVANSFHMDKRANYMLYERLRKRFGVKSIQDLNADQFQEAIDDTKQLFDDVLRWKRAVIEAETKYMRRFLKEDNPPPLAPALILFERDASREALPIEVTEDEMEDLSFNRLSDE